MIVKVHEVLVQNTDRGSVITWDFDVIKHDVMFCVFRTKDAFKINGKPPPTPTLGNIGSFNMGPTAEPEHFSNIGRGWKEGEDYFRVEVPIVCHDGESIQESVAMNKLQIFYGNLAFKEMTLEK